MQSHGSAKGEKSTLSIDALQVLTPAQVLEVDRALADIGPFGEVRLIKIKGRLRFLQQLDSQDLYQLCSLPDEE